MIEDRALNKTIKKIIISSLIGLLCAAVFTGVRHFRLLETAEGVGYNWRSRWTAKPTPHEKKIKLILIDQASFNYMKEKGVNWPWFRSLYKYFVDYLEAGGAKAVLFDIYFSEKNTTNYEDDLEFAAALQGKDNMVFALKFSSPQAGVDGEADQINAIPEYVRVPQDHPVEIKSSDYRHRHQVYPNAVWPSPGVAAGTRRFGHVNGVKDPLGVMRQYIPIVIHDHHDKTKRQSSLPQALVMTDEQNNESLMQPQLGHVYPRLELLGVALAEGRDGAPAPIEVHEHEVKVGQYSIPIDTQGRAHLRYRAPLDGQLGYPYQQYSAQVILESAFRIEERMYDPEAPAPQVDPSEFKDAYVIIGVSAAGGYDFHSTPMNPHEAGPVIVATGLDNILSGDFLVDPPLWAVFLWCAFLSMLGAGLSIFAPRAWQVFIVFVVMMSLPLLAGTLMFDQGWYMPILAPSISTALAMLFAFIYIYATEGSQKRFIRKAFEHYLSPVVVREIVNNPDRLKLGGDRRELSIFFSDLQGFSTISEGMDPTDLIAMLNDYLSDMVAILRDENGTLDKFEGDAIIAFWNAPLDEADHHLHAVRCALRCQRRLAQRNEEFKAMCGHDLKMRIGINTGPVVVGNMGGQDRFDYSMLGNAANLAARLEGANKAFGTLLMISESTYEGCKTEIIVRETGLIRVVGIDTPVRVYEPVGLNGEPEPNWLPAWREALQTLRSGDHAKALSQFQSMQEDPVAQRYIQQLSGTGEAGDVWDGIFNLTSK